MTCFISLFFAKTYHGIFFFVIVVFMQGYCCQLILDHQLSLASKFLSLVPHYLLQASSVFSMCLSPSLEVVVHLLVNSNFVVKI